MRVARIEQRSLAWRIAQILARVLTTLLFDLKVDGLENVPATGGVLLVSNHQSNLDPVLLGVRLTRPVNYIAKSELFEGRIGGWVLRNVFNAFPVRQGTGDVAAVRETIARLREGHLLNLYPEGARTETGEIGPMLRGVGLIVRRAGVPVIPVVIDGSFHAWPKHRRCFRPHPVRIRYGKPIDLAQLNAEQVVNTVDRVLHRMLRELRGARDDIPSGDSPYGSSLVRRRGHHLHRPRRRAAANPG
jgi:1-acyl-sn-glycerol-3-phosphate acyltransferase